MSALWLLYHWLEPSWLRTARQPITADTAMAEAWRIGLCRLGVIGVWCALAVALTAWLTYRTDLGCAR